ncbi:MAG TPA: hypothetical protein VFN49_03690 [Candidatus Aquilonibacter sp.]|nr:hypothetical protein [Candidatus Aquilonibacter sp.]
MADGGKHRGLPLERKADLKKRYEAGEPVAKLSREFGVRRHTIAEWAKKETWTVHVSVQVDAKTVQQRAQSNVIDLASRKAVEQAEADGTIDEIKESIAAHLLATAEADKLAGEYMVDLLEKAKAGAITPAASPGEQTIADVAKAVMAAYRTFTATVRENAGIKTGAPTLPQEKPSKVDTVKLIVVRPPTGTDG